MVIYSNEIKDFLDKIYFYELTHRDDVNFPLYHYYEAKLYSIDKLSRHIPSTTFPMTRDGLFGLIVGRLEFGYSFDGENVYVQYYINREPKKDWLDWIIREEKRPNKIILSEFQLRSIVREIINVVFRE